MATRHRKANQWQDIIQQWQASNLSASQFCKDQNIGYASFCNWRKRLASEASDQEQGNPAQFINLGSLQANARGWTITLSLGNGVELRLAQD
ncbi:IS66 family insertion sequence element accessory protein TnpB [Pseudomaricurvus alcaniphilus]|uniref:IS66 family insertion sequence element accessory protein TnpA n=1 Tax=Pseudomaricurvus alcaniphilus TaxID=1166482 RepID=UPI001408B1D7|nr:IS66 family insertion sequence element accessory protein TnpB [Pseudomaricurvus alcaniphilus]NHN37195.1 IS66 family insertion sequence element accessory protein TnpB [Pseudomaricurvus alcaniphilus]